MPAGTAQSWHRSVCRYCGTGCTIQVGLRHGKVTDVRGDPAGHNKGVICVKGSMLVDLPVLPGRLTRPMIRRGGRLMEASWDEAMGLVVASTPASPSSARRWWRPRCTARASPCHPGAQRRPREGALRIDCSRLGGTGGRSQSDEGAVRVPSFDQIDSVVSRAVTKGPSARSRSAIFALSALPRSR